MNCIHTATWASPQVLYGVEQEGKRGQQGGCVYVATKNENASSGSRLSCLTTGGVCHYCLNLRRHVGYPSCYGSVI